VVLLVVALLLCSATTASAAFLITGSRIKDGSVTGRDVRDHSLTAKDLKGTVHGPAGPVGPSGPGGGTGPDGPAGPPAISGPLFTTATATVAGRTSGDATVACPTGTVAVGGGGSSPFGNGELEQSSPSDGRGHGWTVSFFNLTNASITITAAVVCVTAH
jgi:hypothetical protein